ncbi:unnamed protein product [Cuscuta epithymum]|uniref:Uncharacterized protein n=1 Tax=Cuscuta epithymum TaxID=186058 RepID=A0AAV0GCD1_9ASTE|nr:unnamed protein product [Cuscuta epithymum]CAH9145455.1 unnamed protein product [Cuscuta epithymum]
MASATVVDTLDAAPLPADSDRPLQLDSIPTVDLRLLSQSELYTLSLCSPSAFDPRRSDDVVSPKLDRSVFNESAGSRKQTYSRLRLAPASSSSALRSRTPHLRASNHNQNHPSLETDPENFQIVSLLKRLFAAETSPTDLVPIPVDYTGSVQPVAQLPNVPPPGFKRKRGRPRKDKSDLVDVKFEHPSHSNGDTAISKAVTLENSLDGDKEVMNAAGVPVDLVALGSLQDPFGMELRRRTEGLEGEAKLLGFLQSLNGQWGSRRKKRRIVDASQFGDTLPKGWKLLLSLKRKAGYVWVYCRRYISPSGRNFISCKEVSTYLIALHEKQCISPLNNVESIKSTLEGDKPATDASKVQQTVDNATVDVTNKETIATSHVKSPPVSNMAINDPLLLGDLQEVHVMDENRNFGYDNTDSLKQNMSSSHKRKKQKSGQSITDGVIMKDGKFECQFCHKSFDERHRYNGHVGTHVKNQVKSANESLQTNVGPQTDSRLQEPIVLDQELSETKNVDAEFKTNTLCQDNLDDQDGEDLTTLGNFKNADESEDLFSIRYTRCSSPEAVISHDDKLDDFRTTSNLEESEKVPTSASALHSSADNVEVCDFGDLQLEKDSPDVEKESISGLLCVNNREDDVQMNDITPSSLHAVTEGECDDVLQTLSVDEDDRVDNLNILFSSCIDEQKFDDISNVGNSQGVCGEPNNDDFGCNTSWGKNIDSADEKYGSQFPECVENEKFEKNDDPSENYAAGNVSTSKVDELDINELDNVNNDALIFPFSSSSHGGLNVDTSSTDLKQDRNLHFSLFGDDNDTEGYKSNDAELYAQGPPETAILPQDFGEAASNQAFTRINGLHCSGHQDLNLTFGNTHVEFGTNADIMQLQQGGYPTGTSSFQIGMGQTYGGQSSLVHNNDHRRVEHQKQGVGVGLQNSSFNSKFGDFGNNYNTAVYPNSCWGEERMDSVGKFGKNFMGSVRGNVVQANKGTMDGSIWRNSVGNLLNHDSSLAANANSLVQSSNCFQTYDLMSDKGEGLFKMNDRSGSFEGLRSDRSEPVEYSFMGTQSLSCSQQEPKGFPFGVDMGGGFNPSFWMGKDGGGAQNASVRNVVPTVCIWCSSTFYQEAMQSGTQGVVGSMCPTCSSRI